MRQFSTTLKLIQSKSSNPTRKSIVDTQGYEVAGDGGAAKWKYTGISGQTPSQSPAQLGDTLLNDATGNQWAMVLDNTLEFNTFAELELSEIGNIYQRFICKERANAHYILQPSGYVALAGDVTLANGLIGKLQVNGLALIGWFSSLQEACQSGYTLNALEDITIDIPSFYADWVTPFNKIQSKFDVTVNLEAGYEITTALTLDSGSYENFNIVSEDAEVNVGIGFPSGSSIIQVSNGTAPKLSTLIDINNRNTVSGYNLTGNSRGFISVGAGMRNGGNRGLHCQNASTCYADGCIFTGFQQAGVHASRASIVQCANADFSGNSQDTANTFGAIYASRGSTIHGPDINASNSGGDGVRVQRLSTIVVPNINLSNNTRIAFVANGGSILSDSGAPTLTNLGGQLAVAQNLGHLLIGPCAVTFQEGMTDEAVDCRDSRVLIDDVTLSGHEGIGIYAEGANAIVDFAGGSLTGGSNGVWANDVATINAANSTILNVVATGVNVFAGSRVNLDTASVTGSGGKDINANGGSYINARNCTTTNGAGTPNITDTNLTGGFNFSNNDSRGLVWN